MKGFIVIMAAKAVLLSLPSYATASRKRLYCISPKTPIPILNSRNLNRIGHLCPPMAAAMAAKSVVAVVLLYLMVCVWVPAEEKKERGEAVSIGRDGVVVEVRKSGRKWSRSRRRRMYPQREVEPPETWMEKVALLVTTAWFIYSETLGRWPLGDLFLGIKHHTRRQGNREVASVYAGNQCLELKGCKIMIELTRMLRLLTLCFLFSKKPYPVLLESAGYNEEDVLLKEPKAGLLKPAFTILRDTNSKSFILLIRGALSVKERLTAATGALVPFHHLVSTEGRIHNVVIGYAHCGMVAAARWIAKCSIPCLFRAVNKHPDYKIKIIGHSMGAGIAALLTYILREHGEFSSTVCVAFGPAACMSWELAEFGKHFVTTVVNATDLVPTFSAVSVDNLRSEIKASSWLKNKIQHTGFFKGLHNFTTALKSCMPFLCLGRARVSSEGKFPQQIPESTEDVIRHEALICRSLVSCCSCCSGMAASQQAFNTRTSPNKERAPNLQIAPENDSVEEFIEKLIPNKFANICKIPVCGEIAEDQVHFQVNHVFSAASAEMIQDEFWHELKKDVYIHNEIMEGLANEQKENGMSTEASVIDLPTTLNDQEVHQLYPPGKILHMVAIPALDQISNSVEDALSSTRIGIYETPREMYGKIRLAETMIDDHYMPRYKRMMELLIHKLKEENNCCATLA